MINAKIAKEFTDNTYEDIFNSEFEKTIAAINEMIYDAIERGRYFMNYSPSRNPMQHIKRFREKIFEYYTNLGYKVEISSIDNGLIKDFSWYFYWG